jgi:hypothetical protein
LIYLAGKSQFHKLAFSRRKIIVLKSATVSGRKPLAASQFEIVLKTETMRLLLLIFTISLYSCNNAQEKKVQEKQVEEIAQTDFPPIKLKNWKATPKITGRIATEKDVKNGNAIFYIKNNANQIPNDLNLPMLAYLNNDDEKSKKLVVVIQVEPSIKGNVVGYRNPEGGSGACLFNELKFLTKSEVIEIENFGKWPAANSGQAQLL